MIEYNRIEYYLLDFLLMNIPNISKKENLKNYLELWKKENVRKSTVFVYYLSKTYFSHSA